MKKVLIALDYDPTVQMVAEKGYALAKSMGAEAVLLHVISDTTFYTTAGITPVMGYTDHMNVVPLLIENVENLKAETQKFLNKSKRLLNDDSIKTLIKEGDTANAVLKAAEEIGADLIVLGSHSRRWLENILIGSVAEKVLKNSTIPLFIVPIRKK